MVGNISLPIAADIDRDDPCVTGRTRDAKCDGTSAFLTSLAVTNHVRGPRT